MEKTVTNETPLSFLTVGEFKNLISEVVKSETTGIQIQQETSERDLSPKTIGKKECSEVTGYSVNTINKMICNKTIPYYKRGAKVIFRKDEIMEWLLKNKISTTEEDLLEREEHFFNKRK